MIRAYDDYGNVVDLVEWESKIRSDEREKFAKWVDKTHIPRNVGFEYLLRQYMAEKGGAKECD